jgi:hypothetical protein
MNPKSETAESTICLKPVSALLAGKDGHPAKYLIPAYQRGYRWTPLQVTQLLDDIWDFTQEPEGPTRSKFYCLQPLVVKLLPNGLIELVDGQQRLTTIHVILTCLKDMASMLTSTFFHLSFATRDNASRPSLDQIDFSREMESIDYYHICQAYRAVQEWCRPENHSKQQQLRLLQHLLNDDISGRNVKVIWFELGKNDNAVDAFTRLNVGKIPLTNDELIRALFLGRGRQEHGADDSFKVQIAYEWDLIEKELQAADFWAFLTANKREQNRIGFLFELIAKADGIPKGAEHDEYKVFYCFSQKLGESTPEIEWLKIKQEFMRLQEWFEDERRITYHIIGFLVTQRVGLEEIRKLSQECAKSQFDRRLRDLVYQCVMGTPAVPPEEQLRVALAAHLDALEYGTPKANEKIRSILLLFNIATLLEHEKSNMRFQFDAFKDGSWDLEHIRSVASDKITDRAAWLEDCLHFLRTQTDDDAKTLVTDVEAYLAPSNTAPTDEGFEGRRKSILEYFHESDDDEERNDIANLTLLDSRTNRSYQNAPFAVKRQTILSLDKAGIFIPLCTRNVFLKAYSAQPGNAIFWTDEDGEEYQQAIVKTLVGLFLGQEAVQ